MSLPPDYVPSPCVQICTLDPVSGLCHGCLRSIREITDWVEMTADEKRATLALVELRRAQSRAR